MTPKTKTTYSHPGANCPSITVIPKDGGPVVEINAGYNSYSVAEMDAFVELWQTAREKCGPFPLPEGFRDAECVGREPS